MVFLILDGGERTTSEYFMGVTYDLTDLLSRELGF